MSYNVGAIEFENWQHTAYAYDGENVNVYVNGALVDTRGASGELLADNNNSHIANWSGAVRHFNGMVDDVAVFHTALPEDEIVGIMNDGLARATGVAAVTSKSKVAETWARLKVR